MRKNLAQCKQCLVVAIMTVRVFFELLKLARDMMPKGDDPPIYQDLDQAPPELGVDSS